MSAKFATLCLSAVLLATAMSADAAAPALDFEMTTLDGTPIDLEKEFAGKVVLFVNVASRCGYTGQYEGLQSLYESHKDKGLVVVGVPCNQFGGQEPGSAGEIAQFCQKNYGVTFPMLEKVDVNGSDAAPLYKYLTTHSDPTGDVSWNFEKFLVGRDGKLAARFGSGTKPGSRELMSAIETELNKSN